MSLVKFHVAPEIAEHAPAVDDIGDYSWRWTCSCGARGRVDHQSDAASMFKWFKHVWKAEGMPWPRDSAPAYVWLREERAAEATAREERKAKRLAR